MKVESFAWNGTGTLVGHANMTVESVTARILSPPDRPISLTLWHADGTGLRIRSTMRNLGPRLEVGVLDFELVGGSGVGQQERKLVGNFHGEPKVWKLAIQANGTTAESGICLECAGGQQLTVVAGAFPHTIAVLGGEPFPHSFEPEYKLERYVKVAMA